MSSHILQFVWPIVDDTYTQAQLIADAETQLDDLADQADAVITGPPWWEAHPAADVHGWTAQAPGYVLIVRVPVDWYGSLIKHHPADSQPDPAVIQRLIDGNPPARVRRADRPAAMAVMATRAEVPAVASRFGVGERAVHQAVYRARQLTQHTPAA